MLKEVNIDNRHKEDESEEIALVHNYIENLKKPQREALPTRKKSIILDEMKTSGGI